MPSQPLDFSPELFASLLLPYRPPLSAQLRLARCQHGDMVLGSFCCFVFPVSLMLSSKPSCYDCIATAWLPSMVVSTAAVGVQQGAATLLHHHENQLSTSNRALAAHLSTALPLNHQQGSQPFITPEAYDALCGSTHLVIRLAQEAQAADQQHSYGSKAPAWRQASDALQAAAAECASVCSQDEIIGDDEDQLGLQEAGGSGQEGEAVQRLSQQWETLVESLVKVVLVWAQNIQRGGPEEAGMPSKTATDVRLERVPNAAARPPEHLAH